MLADPAADVPDATRPRSAPAAGREDEVRSDERLPAQIWQAVSYEGPTIDRWDEEDEWELGELETEGLADVEVEEISDLEDQIAPLAEDQRDMEETELGELETEGLADVEVEEVSDLEDQHAPLGEDQRDMEETELGELETEGLADVEVEEVSDLEDQHAPLAEDQRDMEETELDEGGHGPGEWEDEGEGLGLFGEDPEGQSTGLADLLWGSTSGASQLMLAEAAWRGELLLDPLTPIPAAPRTDLQTQTPQVAASMAAPPVVTRVDLSIRTDFTVRTASGVRFDWAHGEAVRGARAQIVGTTISGLSDARGHVRLNTTGLGDGFHTIRIEHSVADQSAPDLAGPAVADPLASTPPSRIYRPLNVWVHTRGGQITLAMSFSAHGGIGNRSLRSFDASHLPIDWKPVWMRSPMKARERRRSVGDIDLIVVHRPDKSLIGPAINTFKSAQNVANAHYLIDHNGHIISSPRTCARPTTPDSADGARAPVSTSCPSASR